MTFHFLRIFLISLLFPWNGFAFSQEGDEVANENQAYQDCLDLVKSEPKAALDRGLTWRDTGGGLPARHCIALAYTKMGQYMAAALEFETLADEMRRGLGWSLPDLQHPNERGLLAEVYAQGGNAWLLAGDPARALNLFTLGISAAKAKTKTYANLVIDRALAHGELGNFEEALKDLNEVSRMVKPAPELFVLKASAYRGLDNYPAAQAELTNAFGLDPQNADAFLEQGNLDREMGNNNAARQNWMAYLRLYPNGPAADAIRQNLENMDVKIEDGPEDN